MNLSYERRLSLCVIFLLATASFHAQQAPRDTKPGVIGGVEMRVVAVNPKGEFSNEIRRVAHFDLDKEGWSRLQQTGLVHRLPEVGEKPGSYQIRLALRDIVSGGTGSASTFVVVPDLKDGKLTLSDTVLSVPAAQDRPHPLSNLAARTFIAGRNIAWATEVYNAKGGDKKDGRRYKLQWAVRVFRDATLVFETPLTAASASGEGRPDLLVESLLPTSNLNPGYYVLQVVVRDENVKNSQFSRFTDFHIIP